ncbi:MAG: polyprenyl synthetase family protein [Candidatus Obscuribacterales bacterium]|nr:polyprenyl synthetase family protein [Candidatus Obscuribacterales bacterium]
MVATTKFDFEEFVASKRMLVDAHLAEYLATGTPEVLYESMRYSVLSPGKRIRALLCLAAAQAINEDAHRVALPCACAIEMIHAMSLIHDDLPALDNDDIRRGKPTNHKVFGEAIALLAGDALLMLAMETIANHIPASIERSIVVKVLSELAKATGAPGMVGGQVDDIAFTGGKLPSDKLAMLNSIHLRKTGSLIRFSTWSGATLAGANQEQQNHFATFGEILGLAFQITDDLLDVTGSAETLGKTPGKDAEANKLTFVAIEGIDKSKAKLLDLQREAETALTKTGVSKQSLIYLESLLQMAINRVS